MLRLSRILVHEWWDFVFVRVTEGLRRYGAPQGLLGVLEVDESLPQTPSQLRQDFVCVLFAARLCERPGGLTQST